MAEMNRRKITVFYGDTVDIRKLTYCDDYNSYINNPKLKAPKVSVLQHLRFLMILVLLELILLDRINCFDTPWVAVTSLCIVLIIFYGNRVFGTLPKCFFWFLLSVGFSYLIQLTLL